MTLIHRTDGDGWVDCACGQRHWGRFGAAGLMLVDRDKGVLLQHRAAWSHHGGTWAVPGGARASGETALDAATREAAEEAAVPREAVRPLHAWVYDHGTWSYTTIVAAVDRPIEPHPSDPESLEIAWVPTDEVQALPLLPAFEALWPSIQREVWGRLVLVVDAANVVGSRPDGWWHDRAGATARLRDQLRRLSVVPAQPLGLSATLWWPEIVLVTEGRARGVPSRDGVTVVEAPGSGDDAIVATVADAVTADPDAHVVTATADRHLRARVGAVGGSHIGPGALRQLLDSDRRATSCRPET